MLPYGYTLGYLIQVRSDDMTTDWMNDFKAAKHTEIAELRELVAAGAMDAAAADARISTLTAQIARIGA